MGKVKFLANLASQYESLAFGFAIATKMLDLIIKAMPTWDYN